MKAKWEFVGGLDISDLNNLCDQFHIDDAELKATRGVCWSSEPDYSVSMRAIYRNEDEFFEVEASHCSCYGYGGAWQPSEVSKAYVKQLIEAADEKEVKRKDSWRYGALDSREFIDALRELVKR